jgi:hypothetical protein
LNERHACPTPLPSRAPWSPAPPNCARDHLAGCWRGCRKTGLRLPVQAGHYWGLGRGQELTAASVCGAWGVKPRGVGGLGRGAFLWLFWRLQDPVACPRKRTALARGHRALGPSTPTGSVGLCLCAMCKAWWLSIGVPFFWVCVRGLGGVCVGCLQDDTFQESYISTIGVDFVRGIHSLPACLPSFPTPCSLAASCALQSVALPR